jgi:hypothetical protein
VAKDVPGIGTGELTKIGTSGSYRSPGKTTRFFPFSALSTSATSGLGAEATSVSNAEAAQWRASAADMVLDLSMPSSLSSLPFPLAIRFSLSLSWRQLTPQWSRSSPAVRGVSGRSAPRAAVDEPTGSGTG